MGASSWVLLQGWALQGGKETAETEGGTRQEGRMEIYTQNFLQIRMMEIPTNSSVLGPRRKTARRGEDCSGPGNQATRRLIRRVTEEPFPGPPLTPSEAAWAHQHSVALTCRLASSLRQTLGHRNPSSHTLFSQAARVL